LNFRYLVAALYLLGHPLRGRLGVLGALNIGRYIKGYSDVLSLYIILSESFTRHELPALLGTPLVYGHMEKKLANETCDVRVWCIGYFYKNGSFIEGCAGVAVHQISGSGFGHKILGLAGVFTAKLSALFAALRHIAEIIQPLERCVFLLIA
jgi:hypothetical protein